MEESENSSSKTSLPNCENSDMSSSLQSLSDESVRQVQTHSSADNTPFFKKSDIKQVQKSPTTKFERSPDKAPFEKSEEQSQDLVSDDSSNFRFRNTCTIQTTNVTTQMNTEMSNYSKKDKKKEEKKIKALNKER